MLGSNPSPLARAFGGRRVSLDTPLSAASRWLGVGTHDVVIEDVDTARLEEGRIMITFADANKAAHREFMWLVSRSGDQASRPFLTLLVSTLPDIEAQQQMFDLLSDERTYRAVLEAFRGMKCRITLEMTDGYTVEATEAGYQIVNSGEVVAEVAHFSEIDGCVKELGLRKAYRKISNIEVSTDADINISAFRSVVASLAPPETSDGDPESEFAPVTAIR